MKKILLILFVSINFYVHAQVDSLFQVPGTHCSMVPPKGFEKDHANLELLKNRHFIVSSPIKDKDLLSESFDKTVLSGFKAMQPLLEYLREATAK